jgi:hypothetical protein
MEKMQRNAKKEWRSTAPGRFLAEAFLTGTHPALPVFQFGFLFKAWHKFLTFP